MASKVVKFTFWGIFLFIVALVIKAYRDGISDN